MSIPYFAELRVAPIKQSIIILDIDGTLLADDAETVDIQTSKVVRQLVEQGNQIYLVSNGFSHQSERNRAIAQGLGVTFFPTEFKKPLKISVLPIITAATKPVLVIGDKFLTDGLLAVNLGVPFVEVRSLRSGKEPLYAKAAYAIDSLLKKVFGALAAGPHYRDELYGAAPSRVLTILCDVPLSLSNVHEVILFRSKEYIKNILFALTRNPNYRTIGGPQSVFESLKKGLSDIQVAYRSDPWKHQVTPVVGVIAGVNTLRFALEQKRKGFIKTIVAGPNIVVAPTDEDNLIKSPLIDRVVVPSEWNKKWWLTFDQLFDSKAVVWASGVDDLGGNRDSNGVCIVYSKNADEKLFNKLIEILWTYKLPIVVSHYGQFRQEEYFRLLKKARMLVYLSTHESQGIALHEAWMADVPTLVWNRGFFQYQDKRFEDETVSAPYLSAECGLSFKDDGDFERKLIEFQEKYHSFHPREYSLAHFTNAIAARKYIDIIESASKI